MPKNFADLKKYFTKIQLWAVVAAVLTAGLFGYYGFEGWRYWEASQKAQSLKIQKVVLDRTVGEKLRGQAALTAELDIELSDMARVEQAFDYPQTDDLIGVVAGTARQLGVTVTSISAGQRNPVIQGEMQYQVQSMAIAMEGSEMDVYRFFETLHNAMPTVQYGTVRLASGDEDTPTLVNVQLSFWLAPEVVEAKEVAAAGKASSGKPDATKGAK